MAVVIRLLGLRITAGSEDIRKFFSGLKIPDGGVHIIGGERDEAFIIFASDEDARRAMTRSGGCIKGTPVNLLLSSKSEMQSILEASTKKPDLNQQRPHKEEFRRRESEATDPSFSEKLSMEKRRGIPEMGNRFVQDPHGEAHIQNRKSESNSVGDLFLFLKGMPFSVTEDEVRHFFQGLIIDAMILMKNHRGQNNGKGIVKFTTRQDAREGMKRDREYIGSRFVELYPATEEEWINANGAMAENADEFTHKYRKGSSPPYRQRYPQERARSRSPVGHSLKCAPPADEEFCVLLENLSYSVQKRDVKELFRNAGLQDDQILYLLDSEAKRTRSLFVLFRSLKDYCDALTHHKKEFLNRCLYISPISKEKMVSILETNKHTADELPERHSRSQERLSLSHIDPYNSDKVCLYVRNLPFDVRKVEIMDFFLGFSISEDSVILLRDNRGAGIGEALVIFQTEVEAMTAQSLNGQRFLGSELMLKCISRSQMREFGVADPAMDVHTVRERSSERYSARNRDSLLHSHDKEYSDFMTPDGHIPLTDLQVHIRGDSSLDSNCASPYGQQDGGNGSFHGGFGPPPQHYDGPTCLKLVNLPLQITINEIYDFCYGYRVIPGSISLQYNRNGIPKGSATVVFESRQEALTAVEELSGRPIGMRKIQLVFV
ncbi:RNA binding motif protein 12Bb [Osmerus mordax]|uniref:RNA binding motif protein 12Bb n=1 Tax=Osmerus mordax TaxID=8014 RepID=UPI0035101CC2